MLNNNHKIESECHFAETLITVLFGEANDTEMARFESHLQTCDYCSSELSSFSTVKNAVSEWREAEFSHLVTPNIIFQAEEIAAWQKPNKLSFLENLQSKFPTFSFNWKTATATFAGFVFLSFLIIYSVYTVRNTHSEQAQVLPTRNESLKNSELSFDINSAAENSSETFPEKNKRRQSSSGNSNSNSSTVPDKSNSKSRKMEKPQKSVQVVNTESNKKASSPKAAQTESDFGSLIPEDSEDKSIRLTDLLEEVEPSV